MTLVLVYLSAIVAANLTVAAFGPSAAIAVGFLFVGLDLTCRDALHDRWRGDQLALRMAALIAVGGLISYILNAGAGQIALASTVAFVAAATADALVYRALGDRAFLLRVNGSNVVGATVDSLLFIPLAFGVILPIAMTGQLLAKTVGGFAWSLVINAVSIRRRAA